MLQVKFLLYECCFRLITAIEEIAYVFSHLVQSHTVGTADVAFATIVRPWAEDEQTAGSACVEKHIHWLVVIAKAIVCQENERPLLLQQHLHHLLLIGRDERRDHQHLLARFQYAGVLVVAQLQIVAMPGLLHHGMSDVHRVVSTLHQESHIPYPVVASVTNHDILLHTEKAWPQSLRGQPLRVHVQIADSVLQLAVAGHRADEGHFPEYRLQLAIGLSAHLPAQGGSYVLQPAAPFF